MCICRLFEADDVRFGFLELVLESRCRFDVVHKGPNSVGC